MSRREARRRPYPAPEGMHWEVGDSHFERGGVPGFATYYLVDDGRHVDRHGMYEDYERGDGEVPRMPGPGPDRMAAVMVEHQTLTETRRTVRELERKRAARDRISQMRQGVST